MALKHTNVANIFASVDYFEEKKSEGGADYLALHLICHGVKNGTVKVFARIWGEKGKQFLKQIGPMSPPYYFRFQGVMDQYQKDGYTYTNYIFFNWSVSDQQEQDPRAAFVILGRVVKSDPGKWVIVSIERKDDAGKEQKKEIMLWTHPEVPCPDEIFHKDSIVRLKGYLRAETACDEFGESGGAIRPYIFDPEVKEAGTPF